MNMGGGGNLTLPWGKETLRQPQDGRVRERTEYLPDTQVQVFAPSIVSVPYFPMSYSGDIIATMSVRSVSECRRFCVAWHVRVGPATSVLQVRTRSLSNTGPVSTARCSSKVSISRIKTLNRGGYKLEQEIRMDVMFAGLGCMCQ